MASHSNISQPVVVIVGPTGSGKSALAQEVAVALGGEIVSADSMQIYKGMDIGTGKVLPAQMKVPHHGLDLVNPGDPFSAALFQDYARRSFADIDSRGNRCILCGGTGFYVRAAIDDYSFPKGEQVDNPIRERYNAYAADYGADALWELLHETDPASAEVIPPNDVKRVVRAFELLDDGTSYAEQKRKLAAIEQLYPAVFIGLSVDPDVLRKRIDDRVDEMVEAGLVQEVEILLAGGFRSGLTAPQAIGYKEIVAYLDGESTLDEAIDDIKIATHRYAKRQRTWFRKDKRISWIAADELNLCDMKDDALRIVDRMNRDSEGASYEPGNRIR